MHLPSNLPTFARPLIYRTKIVSSRARKVESHDCHEAATRRVRERFRAGFQARVSSLYHYFLRKIKRIWYSRSFSLSFSIFPEGESSRSLPRDIPVFTRINSRVAINVNPREYPRGRVVAPNCKSTAPDRITSGVNYRFSGKFSVPGGTMRVWRASRACASRPKVRIRRARHLQLGESSPHHTRHPPCVSACALMLSSARPMGNFGLCHGNFSLDQNKMTTTTTITKMTIAGHGMKFLGMTDLISLCILSDF